MTDTAQRLSLGTMQGLVGGMTCDPLLVRAVELPRALTEGSTRSEAETRPADRSMQEIRALRGRITEVMFIGWRIGEPRCDIG